MSVEIITKEDLQEFKHELLNDFKQIIGNNPTEQNEWLSTKEAMKLLGIKGKTKLQQLRDGLDIKFSQHGKIIKYSRTSILTFLERNVPKF